MKASKTMYGIAAAMGCAFAVGVVLFLAPSERGQVTPYADFERDLAAGKIDEVTIAGTTYRYRVAREPAPKTTTGPKATLASIAAMRAHGDARPPKVRFEP